MMYGLKNYFRSKGNLFWNFVFPIILITIINTMFSQKDVAIKIASENPEYTAFFKELDNFEFVETKDPKKDLLDKKLDVFIDKNGEMMSKRKDINTFVANYFMSSYDRLKRDPAATSEVLKGLKKIKEPTDNLKFITMQTLFSILIMTAFYSAFGGLEVSGLLNPINNDIAQRILMAGKSKVKILLQFSLSNLLISVLPVIVSTLYAVYVLKIDLITKPLLTIIPIAVLVLFGFSFGLFFGSFNAGDFTNALILVFMLAMSFMSGMSGNNIIITILQKVPFLLKINPMFMAVKNLTFINTGVRDSINLTEMLTIVAISVVLITIAAIRLGRKRYDSI